MAIVTVGPSGADYTSLSAAEAGEQTDLVALGEPMEFVCAAFEDTTAVVFDGWTTSATRYIEVRAATGAEAQMPWSTSAYRITTAGQVFALRSMELFFRVRRIQLEYSDNRWHNGGGFLFSPDAHDGSAVVEGCVARNADQGGDQVNGTAGFAFDNLTYRKTVLVRNCVAIGFAVNYSLIWNPTQSANAVTVLNCTSHSSPSGTGGRGFTISADGGSVRMQNCLAANATANCFEASGTTTLSHNASADTTASGTGSRISQTFTFVNAAGGDLRLTQTDAGGRAFGTDLSADGTYPFGTDLFGTSRVAPWDIGACESGLIEDISVVASSGGDYTSLAAWEAGEQRNLVTAKATAIAECAAFEDTNALVIDGWTTSASCAIRVRPAVGAEAQVPWSTSAYRLVVPFLCISVLESFTHIERIQIEQSADDFNVNGFQSYSTSFVYLIGCHIRALFSGGSFAWGRAVEFGDNTGPVFVINNVINWQMRNAAPTAMGILIQTFDGSYSPVYNNTVIGNPACAAGVGIQDGYDHILARNNLATGWGTAAFAFMTAGNCSNNASGDATATGTGARINQTFTFENAAAGDYHLTSADAGARTFGANLSADGDYAFAEDFEGTARTEPWDIGAFAFVSGVISGVGSAVVEALLSAVGTVTGAVYEPEVLSHIFIHFRRP